MNLITITKRHQQIHLSFMLPHHLTACCGIREISGLVNFQGDSEQAMLAACFRLMPEPFGTRSTPYGRFMTPDLMRFRYFIFSQAGRLQRNRYGTQFAAYIEKMGFGTVIQTDNQVNPNTGNEVIVYVWTINREALITWFNRQIAAFNAWIIKQPQPLDPAAANAAPPPLPGIPHLVPVLADAVWTGNMGGGQAPPLPPPVVGLAVQGPGGFRG